ncbi:FAD-dependent monooxygenase [Aureimonas phyllosphaerae]|uniref:Salicylate hydroxylase n=1 Tax=Aureimonas phyllosphaerae TaxID=1166078 RepID=A0A7W6BRB8_9HYPH|nr:FAD-dependent monooxygenase [Aureimonas phyllosphaerae]MBB3935452.1 salicylate hydroxylase [Aureimonas phyllosphaerae]MBB3959460.1 salicylate hydroxylase [Aureimonas phyllosphaerae]SFF53438.1 salicylate hydroxylase [Aureimonas phyllosphaerae]
MPDAIVTGAGIAGLTTAIALAQKGWRVRVRERAARLEPVGAGIQLSPNALDVLHRLGVPIDQVGIAADSVVLRDGPSGRRIATVPVSSSDGRGYRVLHRADLQRVLLETVSGTSGVDLYLGDTLVDLDADEGGVRTAFETRQGTTQDRSDLLVAADGVHSAAARLLGFPAPVASGATALRFIAGSNVPSGPAAIEAWLGHRRHVVRYRIDAAGTQNLVVIVPDGDPSVGPVVTWDPALAAILAAAEPVGSWPLLTVEPRWRAETGWPIALIGDAAHAMLPYAAQGAAIAIEDAFVLASCVSGGGSPADGLRRFEALRTPRVKSVLDRVAFHKRVYHLPRPLSFARDLALAVRSPTSLRRDLAWLYDWRASAGGDDSTN